MDCSFAPSERWFVFDTDTGETLEKDFGSKGGAIAWMGEVSGFMRQGMTQIEAIVATREAVEARRSARRESRRQRPQRPSQFKPQRRAA